jgi:hypothetical protein
MGKYRPTRGLQLLPTSLRLHMLVVKSRLEADTAANGGPRLPSGTNSEFDTVAFLSTAHPHPGASVQSFAPDVSSWKRAFSAKMKQCQHKGSTDPARYVHALILGRTVELSL